MNDANENLIAEKIKASHRAIYTDIEIDATAQQVWRVLTDTASYRNWASFLIEIQGEIKDGKKITTVFQLDPKKEKRNSIEHTISVTEGSEFNWAEKGPGGISDNHHFKVEALPNGKTRFIQSDEIKGGVTWLMGGNLTKLYSRGYQAFNRSLKAEVERRFE
ncbi:MAG: SRPBCC domain-containing protein [bacterium]|nr:SRPBCC domain-containing protein [bacterium]